MRERMKRSLIVLGLLWLAVLGFRVASASAVTINGCVIKNHTSCARKYLHGKNLSGAHLEYANLAGANLSNANLQRADLRRANLTGANLTGARLTGARLGRTNLSRAVLTGVTSGRISGLPAHLPSGWGVARGYLLQRLSTPVFTLTPRPGSLALNVTPNAHVASYRAQVCSIIRRACSPAQVVHSGAVFAGLTGGVPYRVALTALGNGTRYSNSPVGYRTAAPRATPLAVPSFTVSAGPDSLTLNSFSAVPNASSYSAQVCNAVGAGCHAALTVTTAGHTFTSLAGGTAYTIQLTAVGDGSTYVNSAVASVTGVPNGPNLIVNPSVETASVSDPSTPQAWYTSSTGTNTPVFSYLNTGRTGSRSVEVALTSFTSGSADWSTNAIPVTPGQMYDLSDYYESNIPAEVDVTWNMSDGSVQFPYVYSTFASPNGWTAFDDQITAPPGAVSVNVYHDISAVGWLTTDDYSLTPFAYEGFHQPILTINFDDGWATMFTNGLPLLNQYGIHSTDYIITSVVGVDPSYMTLSDLQQLQASGQEIGSHTVTHPDLTTLTPAAADIELQRSQSVLQGWLNTPIADFAAPYGATNGQLTTDAAKYYQSYRGVEPGFNARNNLNPYNILVQNMLSTTTLLQVESWVNEAIATKTWLVLVYHQVDPNFASAGLYDTTPSDLSAQLAFIKSTGIAVETTSQALAETSAQIGP